SPSHGKHLLDSVIFTPETRLLKNGYRVHFEDSYCFLRECSDFFVKNGLKLLSADSLPFHEALSLRPIYSLLRRGRRWRRAPLGLGNYRNRPRAVLPYRPHRKKMVVGRNVLQYRLPRLFRKIENAPARLGRLSPQNFKSRAIRIIVCCPRNFRIRSDR